MDKKPEECKAGAPDWMVTYGDLVTLLMCFFVLLFAFSEIDAQKFEAVMKSFQGSAGVLESGKSLSEDQLVFDASPEENNTPQTTEAEPLEILEELLSAAKEEIEEAFEGQEFEADIIVEILDNKLVIRLKNNVLFDSARASIKPEAIDILSTIGEVLKGELFTDSMVEIEGHTDDVPINTTRFPDNWALSAGRATSVLQYFVSELEFSQERLKIAGYGEFKPIDSNLTSAGRANNRRVEIIIEKFNFEVPVEEATVDEPTGDAPVVEEPVVEGDGN